jgi:hypothetical protein
MGLTLESLPLWWRLDSGTSWQFRHPPLSLLENTFMKKVITLLLVSLAIAATSEARGRKGSHRHGGHGSHGKGSHYHGGH